MLRMGLCIEHYEIRGGFIMKFTTGGAREGLRARRRW
jgi:hypothetical protein